MTVTITVLDLFLLGILHFIDILFNWFLFSFELPRIIRTAGSRLFKKAFHTRTDRSELHLALITTIIASVLLYFEELKGGRDVLISSIGLYVQLHIYAVTLLILSLLLHIGMLFESYLLRCVGIWLLSNYLTFTAGILIYKEYKSLLPWIYLFIAYVAQGICYKVEHTDEKGDFIR